MDEIAHWVYQNAQSMKLKGFQFLSGKYFVRPPHRNNKSAHVCNRTASSSMQNRLLKRLSPTDYL
jgi:hypothetical protein